MDVAQQTTDCVACCATRSGARAPGRKEGAADAARVEAPAEDARGAQYTPYEHNVSGLVQMDNVVFQDIVLPHLTAQAAAALRRTCVEFSRLRRQESKGTYLRAMVPARVRWLPYKLRAGHQSEGVLPHCKMKSRDGLGRVTLVNAIYSERLVNIVVDFLGRGFHGRRRSSRGGAGASAAGTTDGRSWASPSRIRTRRWPNKTSACCRPITRCEWRACAALPRRDRRGQRRRQRRPAARRAARHRAALAAPEECAQALAQARGGDAVAARGARREETLCACRPTGALPTRQ